MTICTYNARTLASEASVEDLMMQAKKIKYDVIELTETRNTTPYTPPTTLEKNCSLKRDNRGVGGIGVLVNTHLAMNIDSFDCVRHVCPTSDYDDEEVETFYVKLEKFYKEDHTFYKVIVGDFNAKIGPRRSPEELHIGTHGLEWNEQGERLSEFIMSTKTIHGDSQLQKPPPDCKIPNSLGPAAPRVFHAASIAPRSSSSLLCCLRWHIPVAQ
ncbi:unnamed protein product [Heligmosomoides polygyrus]|uniref:Endo/exonuclease/phosphatase domain-containing protein n=1 Tax=Heligmosomoides polygyrus TaxID=6339 RepID=A0A183FLF7_HELPZ|nr:unnamed protein product [Heligmosomoides polygyrus]